jgi:hypothetical protein
MFRACWPTPCWHGEHMLFSGNASGLSGSFRPLSSVTLVCSAWVRWLVLTLEVAVGSLANIGYADAIRALPNMQSQAVTSPAHFASIALGNQFIVIWAWYFLVINTALTTSIIYSILCVSRLLVERHASADGPPCCRRNSLRYERFYGKIICALVESALVSWIGLLRFGISGAISFNSLGSARDVAGITTLPLAFVREPTSSYSAF